MTFLKVFFFTKKFKKFFYKKTNSILQDSFLILYIDALKYIGCLSLYRVPYIGKALLIHPSLRSHRSE